MSTLTEIEEAIEQLPAPLVDEWSEWLEQRRKHRLAAPTGEPDFLARAKAIWGESPQGLPLSAMVSDARR